MTGETGQAVGTAIGAGVASIIPGVGTASGALAGQKFVKGMNAIAKVGSLGGKNRPSGDPDNPISTALRKFSGNVISKSLKKDSQNVGNFTPSEKEKHKLVGDYAKKLQGNKDRYRPGHGNSKGRTV